MTSLTREERIAEEWRPIPGYEHRYEVSDDGDVRSVGFFVRSRGEGKTWRPSRTLKPTPHRQGYRMVTLTNEDGERQAFKVSRLVLLTFIGEPPPGKEDALHEDDIPTHDHLSNLRWGDQSENNHDCVRNGRHSMANKQRCLLGHLLVAPNLTSSTIQRRCLACSLATNNRLQDDRARASGRPRMKYHRGRDGFLRRAGETEEQEAHRRYNHIMRDQLIR